MRWSIELTILLGVIGNLSVDAGIAIAAGPASGMVATFGAPRRLQVM
jgi:hypothetical protein